MILQRSQFPVRRSVLGDCQEDVDYLVSLLKERFAGHEIVVNMIGSVIGTHSGAGTVALFFRGKHR